MVVKHILYHGLFYAFVITSSLLLIMVTTSPRVWGYTDYSDAIKAKIPPQTQKEKRQALLIALPWLIFTFIFPIFSTYYLKAKLEGEITFWQAFLNIFVLITLGTLADLIILDWLVVSRITPRFVVIPGTEKADYKDFSHHYMAHARAVLVLLPLCVIIAGFVVCF